MRGLPGALSGVFCLALLAGPAFAGTASAPDITDEAGDVVVGDGGVPIGQVGYTFQDVDLTAAWVNQTTGVLYFGVQAAGDVAPAPLLPADPGATLFLITFVAENVTFDIGARIADEVVTPIGANVTAVAEGNVLHLQMPDRLLPPGTAALTGFFVATYSEGPDPQFNDFNDRAPDEDGVTYVLPNPIPLPPSPVAPPPPPPAPSPEPSPSSSTTTTTTTTPEATPSTTSSPTSSSSTTSESQGTPLGPVAILAMAAAGVVASRRR